MFQPKKSSKKCLTIHVTQYKIKNNFINSENSKTINRTLLNLEYKINVKGSDEYITLSNLSIYYIQKKIKSYQNNKFKLFGPTWNDNSESAGTSYSVLDIQDYFE